MPAIKPISVQDCIDFATDNKDEIKEGVYDVHVPIAWMGQLPEEVFLFLLSHCPSTQKMAGQNLTAEHPRGAELLEQLSQDEDHEVRQCVASNPHVPQDVLLKLTADFFKEVRLAAARNPALPIQTIEVLSRENSTSIREAVLDNPHLTLKIINRLAADRADRVQKKIIQRAREATHPPLIPLFARCANPDVRVSVCSNDAITFEMLEILYRDENQEVHQAAVARMQVLAAAPKTDPKIFVTLASFPQEAILIALARNPKAPKEILLVLTDQKNPLVKMALLGNSAISLPILEKLAADADDRVRLAVVHFPKTPVTILEKLALDSSFSVRNALAENPLEQERRQQNQLCLGCGQPLSRINIMIGSLCLKCNKQKVIDSFTR